MRLLIVTQFFWPENFRINDLVDGLLSYGHDVTILTGVPNYPEGNVFKEFKANKKKFNAYKKANVIRIPIITRGQTKIGIFFNFLSFILSASLIGSFRVRKKKFDLIFTYAPSPITVCIPSIVISKLKNIPSVIWVLDLWPETLVAVNIVRTRFILSLVSFIVRFIYKHSHIILAQSKSFIIEIKKYSPTNKKIYYFPGWSESLFFSNRVKSNKLNKNNNKFIIMFAGNIGEAQDFPSILSAAEILKKNQSISWVIVGNGRMFEWLKKEVKKRGLENSFILLGQRKLEEMPELYQKADALLVSLKKDRIFTLTIPAKIQTYLAIGKPILGMLDGEGADVIKKSKSGFCCNSGNYKKLSVLCKKLSLMNKEKLKQLGENAITFSRKEYNRNLLVEKLDQIFTKTLT